MSVLCIDSGNTRIKWRLVSIAVGLTADDAQGYCTQQDRESLATHWAMLAPERIVLSNVAGPDAAGAIGRALSRAGTAVPIERVRALAQLGPLTNGYAEPERLGADRWAALCGAIAAYPAQMLVIASLGTATTVDVISAEGQFEGGIILPGVALMRRALVEHTAGLPLANGQVVALPTNTDDAIESGIWAAQCGAITRVVDDARPRNRQDEPLRCLITGGDATLAAPLLPFGVIIEDNLVLRGLVEIARLMPRIA